MSLPTRNITVREVNTGLSYQARTDSKGYYTFPVLPVGHYELDVEASGFGSYQRKDIALDTNAALTLDVPLEVGGVSQSVTVSDNTLHVETTSTQMGQVITGRQMTAVPLDGRSFYRPALAAARRGSATPSHPTPCRTWAQPSSIPRARLIPARSP